jgi:radical SAM superfamily enzyme YgiQ (UPF0313 family)
MKKVVFVVPNSKWFDAARWELYPYAVCLLAACIEPEYDAAVVDCNAEDMSLDDSVKRILEQKPDYIGISCMSAEYARHAHAIASGIKAVSSDLTVILGGSYCTLMPEYAASDTAIDYCVLGEGEIVLKKLLNCIDRNVSPDKLDGIAYRRDGKVIIKPQREFIHNLDDLPLPDYSKVIFDRYIWVNEKFHLSDTRDALPVAKIYTSRGCPAGCNFCAVENIHGKLFRKRSVDNILYEIEWLVAKYGIKEIVFYDDNLLFDRERSKKLFQGIIDRKLDLKLKPANVAVYRLDEELLDLMKRAGVTTLIFAIESASNRVLMELIKKPLRVDMVRPLITYAKKLGFRCAGLFVIGTPGETWDEIRDTFHFADSLDIYCHFSVATPFLGTKLYEDAVRHDYLTKDFSFYYHGFSRGWLVTDEFAPFDLEVLRTYEWDRINFSSPERKRRTADFFKVSEAEVVEWSRQTRGKIQERYVPDENKRMRNKKAE